MDGDGRAHGSFAPVSLPSRRPPIERWAVIATVVLVVVVAKPWQSPDQRLATGGPSGPTGAPRPGADGSVAPSPSGSDDPAAPRVASFCLSSRSWLIATVERTVGHAGDQRIHVWRVIEPATGATGPNDPTIPEISIVSEGLTELGWCAPTSGDELPDLPVAMTTWARSPTGVRLVTLDSSRPPGDSTPYGAMYRPPGRGPSSTAASWRDAVYVFRYREANGRQRWFAIDVETRPVASPSN
jgi:hypothetical protein